MTPEDIEVLKRAEEILDKIPDDHATDAADAIGAIISQRAPLPECVNCGQPLGAEVKGSDRVILSIGDAAEMIPCDPGKRWCKACLGQAVRAKAEELAEVLDK